MIAVIKMHKLVGVVHEPPVDKKFKIRFTKYVFCTTVDS